MPGKCTLCGKELGVNYYIIEVIEVNFSMQYVNSIKILRICGECYGKIKATMDDIAIFGTG